jgi:hypothetical protein
MSLEGEGWTLIYNNTLACPEDVESFRMEGDAAVSFPLGRMRLESKLRPGEEGMSNFVFWCPETFPSDLAIEWEFRPLREPGLAMLFFAAAGMGGEDLFDSALSRRTGEYAQYHSGDMNAFHMSYFRRRWVEERQFHTCNLRKSHGFHLVSQGGDPIPDVSDSAESYKLLIVKLGRRIDLQIKDLPIFSWEDDGFSFGPPLAGGKLGFRQMSPLIAEYANLKVYGR